MDGNDLISYFQNGLKAISPVGPIVGAIFTAIFYRKKVRDAEFEKLKAQTSHTENIPYALINQLELNVESHSRTLLCTQTTHPKSGQIVQESFQERFDQQDF